MTLECNEKHYLLDLEINLAMLVCKYKHWLHFSVLITDSSVMLCKFICFSENKTYNEIYNIYFSSFPEVSSPRLA